MNPLSTRQAALCLLSAALGSNFECNTAGLLEATALGVSSPEQIRCDRLEWQ